MAMMSAMIMEGVNAGSADTDLYASYGSRLHGV